jgi:tRNA/rRNA methyltransferase
MTKPVIILVRPQLGENIGTAARAMYNAGLTELRLVAPRNGWPNPHAIKPAAGAACVLDGVKVYDDLRAATQDLNILYATTARQRDMTKPAYTAKGAAIQISQNLQSQNKVGILFGPERTGLNNDDLSHVDAVINIPLNPGYTSLNLAQAVLLVSYEWYQLQIDSKESELKSASGDYATKEELYHFFDHLEKELDRVGFWRVEEKRPVMVRNIRNIFLRAPLTAQEVRTLHGIISDLVNPYSKRKENHTNSHK